MTAIERNTAIKLGIFGILSVVAGYREYLGLQDYRWYFFFSQLAMIVMFWAIIKVAQHLSWKTVKGISVWLLILASSEMIDICLLQNTQVRTNDWVIFIIVVYVIYKIIKRGFKA